MSDNTEAEAIARIARGAMPMMAMTVADRRFLAVADDYTMEDVTDQDRPSHVQQIVTINTAEALAAYVNRFKTEETMLFADVNSATIEAVLDYHGQSLQPPVANEMPDYHGQSLQPPVANEIPVDPAAANHATHRAKLTLLHSEEWKAWTDLNGKLMSQLAFARFIEENMDDAVFPDAATLLETCRTLQGLRKVTFKNAVRTASGSESFAYNTETTASAGRDGNVEIPRSFTLSIPVFFGDDPRNVDAFLRYEIGDSGLTLGFQLRRATLVRQQAFASVVTKIEGDTDVPTVYGRVA